MFLIMFEIFKGLAFSAMAVGKNTLYMLGGRESLYMNSQVFLPASVFLLMFKLGIDNKGLK